MAVNYENRLPPEGINVSEEHPLKEFFVLVMGFAIGIVLLVLVLSVLAGWLVRFIPFETEQGLAEKVFMASSLSTSELNPELNSEQQAIEDYLQALADKLALAQQLPKDMSITVHYIDEGDGEEQTVNAFATLGGHVIMFRGLIEKLPHENALAMVMAHEIAHIKHRDPIVAIGRGVTVGLALASLAGLGDSSAANMFVGQLSLVTALNFSRKQETLADQAAMDTLQVHYGHLGGAELLFEVLQDSHSGREPPVFLSSHPITEKRIEAIAAHRDALLRDKPANRKVELTPLPDILH